MSRAKQLRVQRDAAVARGRALRADLAAARNRFASAARRANWALKLLRLWRKATRQKCALEKS
jgi:hypothetical protein